MKSKEKEIAIALRKQGMTYSEIRKIVPVSKSTLTLWLHSVGLAKKQVQLITQKRIEGQRKGAAVRRKQRVDRTRFIIEKAESEVGTLSMREQWLIGAALYWAEGSKQRGSYIGQRLSLSNSDPEMLRFFYQWLVRHLAVKDEHITLSIYVQVNHAHRLKILKEYWAHALGVPQSRFAKVYFKRHNPKTNRKKVGDNYYGILRIEARRSTDLVRTVSGWVKGIVRDCEIV